jgi:hypothetical protein
VPHIKDESTGNLVSGLLKSAGQLNGNYKGPRVLDGGTHAKAFIQETLQEIIRRYKLDKSIGETPSLKPLIDALKDVTDVSDSKEVAMAVKNLPIILYEDENNVTPQTPRRNNPFSP